MTYIIQPSYNQNLVKFFTFEKTIDSKDYRELDNVLESEEFTIFIRFFIEDDLDINFVKMEKIKTTVGDAMVIYESLKHHVETWCYEYLESIQPN